MVASQRAVQTRVAGVQRYDVIKRFPPIALWLVIAFAGAAVGQDAQPHPTVSDITADVNRLLESNDAKDVAWGAFTASQYHIATAVPLLTSALGRRSTGDGVAQRATELAILDALVQLDARVAAEALRPFVDRWPVPSVILLSNASGDRDAVLMPFVSSTEGPLWRAIANLLLITKPSGFAWRLLTGLRLNIVVYVTSDPGRGYGGGAGAYSEHSGAASSVPGFPPLTEYQFVPARLGATVLSIGPQTVYYQRQVMSPGTIRALNYSSSTGASASDRVQYLNALVKQRFETTPLREPTSITVVWKNPEEFRQQVADQRKRVEDLYHQAVSLLVLSRQLTEDEEGQTLVPNITIRVEDHRTDKTEPLPAIEQPAAGAPVRSPRPGPVRKIRDVRPAWPAAAQKADVRGTVLVEFTIDTDGSVTDARVLRGIPLLDEAALDCVRQWRYEPVLLQGRPFPMHITAAVSFP